MLQAKPTHFANDVWRLILNSSIGVAGFVDVASVLGLEDNREDFGQTLGYWGVPPGPYALLPVLPFRSTVRDWLVVPARHRDRSDDLGRLRVPLDLHAPGSSTS